MSAQLYRRKGAAFDLDDAAHLGQLDVSTPTPAERDVLQLDPGTFIVERITRRYHRNTAAKAEWPIWGQLVVYIWVREFVDVQLGPRGSR